LILGLGKFILNFDLDYL